MPAAAGSDEPTLNSDVFVSYCRADRETVVGLVAGLQARGLRAWVDLEDIPPSAEWMAEIRGAIQSADGCLVVVSPDLARSEVCAEEIELAHLAGKRIVPIMVAPTDPGSVAGTLAALNWIDATQGTLDRALDQAVEALRTDLEHVKAHTRLQVRASEWDRKNDSKALLLRGAEITEAEQVVASSAEPRATPVQARFVQASRAGATRRQRGLISMVALALVVALCLSAIALVQRGQAVENERVATSEAAESRSRELAAASISQLEVDPERSLLLAVEAMASASTPEAVSALRGSLDESHARATLRGSGASVTSARYSPDGGHIVTGGIDGTAQIWDVNDPQALTDLSGHSDLIESVAFDPQGDMVVTASFDGTARVWDGATGQVVSVLRAGDGAVHDASFDPSGERIVTAHHDGNAIVWNARSGARLHVLKGHTRPVYDAGFDPTGWQIVTASDDDSARLWNAEDGSLEQVLEGHTDGLYTASFSPDGGQVVTSSEDGTAKAWDSASGHLVSDLGTGAAPIVGASFSPDGRSVVTAGEDETARLFDSLTGRQVAVLRGHEGEVGSAAFGPDGALVVTSSADGTARVWDTTDGVAVSVLRGHIDEVLDARFSPDGATVATAGSDGTSRIWDVSSGRVVVRGNVSWTSADPTGTMVGVSTWDGTVSVLDAATSQEMWSVDTGVPQTTASFNAAGTLVASGSLDGIIRLWNAKTGDPVRKLRGHEPTFVAADFFDGDDLLSWSDDGTARLWNVATGEESARFRHGPPTEFGGIFEAHLDRGGDLVLTTGVGDGIVHMWDANSGEKLWTGDQLFEPGGIGAALSPTGTFAGTVAGGAVVWDARTGRRVSELDSPGEILGMAFSPDGTRVATRSDDGTARIWDPATGELLVEMTGHKGVVNSVWWDNAGRWIVTTADDGVTRVWDAGSGELVDSIGGGGGPGAFALFTADDSMVVSNSETTVRIDPCDACGNEDELIGLATERFTRTLTSEERSLFLGDTPDTDVDEGAGETPSKGLESAAGEAVPDGFLAPGRYRTTGVTPTVTFALADEWFATFDDQDDAGDSRWGDVVQLQQVEDPSNGLSFVSLDPGRVIDGRKEWDERRNIEPFPRDFAAWLRSHPNLKASKAESVTIAGVEGLSVTTQVTSVPEKNPWPTCGGCATLLVMTLQHETGPLTTDDLILASGPGSIDRWILLKTDDAALLINYFAPDSKAFQRFVPAVQEVLDTVVVGTTDP